MAKPTPEGANSEDRNLFELQSRMVKARLAAMGIITDLENNPIFLALLKEAFEPSGETARLASSDPKAAAASPADRKKIVRRLGHVWARALDVWKTDEATYDFLRRAHPLLEGETPLNVLSRSDEEAHEVELILGRLKYGSAA